MDPFIIAQTIDLAGENPPRLYRQPLAGGDSGAHRWEVRIVRGGQAADLTGCTAAVLARREDDENGVTVRQGATIEGNVASAEFLPEVYALGGRLLAVMVISDASGRVVTSAALRMQGKQYTTGSISDPEGTIPSLEALLARYNDLLSATEAAKAATADARAATEATQAALGDAQTAVTQAQTAVTQAQAALGTAQTAAGTANAAAGKIDNMTVSATPVETGTATAALSTVNGHYHLALGLPKGDTGATPQISVHVQTGEAGSEASVSVSGTAENPVIHLTIPRGDVGDIGALTINGKTPDAGGSVTLGMGDIDGLSDAIANAGGVKTVAGVGPDSAGNVALTAAEVGARPSSWTPTAAEVGARPSSWTPTAAEVGARPSSWTPTAAEVGALAVGGTAADSSKLGGKAPEYYLQPRNLLDNSDFRNPVNQKGQTSYIGSDQGLYTIDRWKIWGNSTLTVNDGYIEITDRAYQYFTPNTFKNTVHTFAAKRLDGTIVITTFNPNQEKTQDIYGNLLGSDAWTTMIGVTGGQYVWAALYEGSYTADTLPPYVPNGYAAELAACNSAPVDVGGGYGGGPLQAYPVGSIYVSATPTSPASLFGGTWEQMKDRFLLGAGDSYAAGGTGGEATHTLTRNEIPNYKIGDLAVMVPPVHGNWSNGGITSCSLGEASKTKPGIEDRSNNRIDSGIQYGYQIDSYGGGSAHNNMPPYLAVYMWKRVS